MFDFKDLITDVVAEAVTGGATSTVGGFLHEHGAYSLVHDDKMFNRYLDVPVKHSPVPNGKTLAEAHTNLAGGVTIVTYPPMFTNMNTVNMASTLFHELVHVEQNKRGDLVSRDGRTYWKGRDMTNVPYWLRPWEIEAYVRQFVWTVKLSYWIGYRKARARRARNS